jgi:pyruvate,water dikinase
LSFWGRIFRKSPGGPPATQPLSLTEQYQRKVQRYLAIVAASRAALQTLARMQADLVAEVYFTPAYVQLYGEVALSQTRRALSVLKDFSRGKEQRVLEVFASRAQYLREAWSRAIERESSSLALPFESHTLPALELLASGVAYPAGEQLVIEAGWGWGAVAGEPEERPWRVKMSPGGEPEAAAPDSEAQTAWLTRHPEQGFKTEPLPAEFQGRPCLPAAARRRLAEYMGLLTSWFQGPQEVVWGLRPDEEVIVFRSAPLGESAAPGRHDREPVEWLSPGGVQVYPGLAAGEVLRLESDQGTKPQETPAGAVLVAGRPARSLAARLSQAAALLVATGEAYNHLAFLAREARVPTIFNCGEALDRLAPGARVGVDARSLKLFAADPEMPPPPEESRPGPGQPVAQRILHGLSPYLFPLAGPAEPGQALAADDCHSLHEILLYGAEARVREMFTLSLRARVTAKDAVSLVTGRLVPILVIDGGGGLSEPAPQVSLAMVSSIPFQAFLGGMMSLPWPKARPLDVKGFISVIGVTATTPQAEDQLRKVSFALISKEYMNFSLCLGYHASTIEALVGENLDDNYIRFHYQGGAASLDRRLRRLQLIGGILTRLGFTATMEGDLLDGMAVGDSGPALLEKLAILGRLEVYTKQMDMVMADDDLMHGYIEDFFEKHVHPGAAAP